MEYRIHKLSVPILSQAVNHGYQEQIGSLKTLAAFLKG